MKRVVSLPSAFLIALMLAAAMPAVAEVRQNVGRATCGGPFLCSIAGREGPMNMNAILSRANSCVSQNFGRIAADGFFDTVVGLDYNKCLRPLPTHPTQNGAYITPNCCIVEQGNDQCVLACTLDYAG